MSEPESILSFHEVTRRYDSKSASAVDRVSLAVESGEILALIGASGSGKTTLLRLAAGLEFPDSGKVMMGNQIVAEARRHSARVAPEHRQLGLVFQDGALFPHLTVEKNVAYGIHRWAKGARGNRIAECLELVHLDGKEKRYPHELSGGERQRLALARAIAPKPRLILLDEPFSNLDPALRRSLREEIRDILQQLDQTALLVTHDPDDALTMASRVAIIEEGRIVQTGTPAEVYRNPVDQYCAERFGPANAIPDPETGTITWRRPEDATWVNDANSSEGTAATVQSVREVGHGVEVRVVPEGETGEGNEGTWLCFLKDEAVPKAGDRGRVVWR